MKLLRNKNIFIGLSVILLGLGYYAQTRVDSPDYTNIAGQFEAALHRKEIALDALLTELDQAEGPLTFSDLEDREVWKAALREIGATTILAFENDSLVLWTDNNLPLANTYKASEQKPGLVQLQNGWYDVRLIAKSPRILMGFILIKKEYPFENRFLNNAFHPDFDIPDHGLLTTTVSETGVLVNSVDGAPFGYLSFNLEGIATAKLQLSNLWIVALLLFLLGILAAVIYLEHLISLLQDHFGRAMVSSVFIISVIALRVLMIWNKFPAILYDLPIFSPSFYGTSTIFPSLGDFFLNGITVCALAYYLRERAVRTNNTSSSTINIWEFTKISTVLLLSLPLKFLIEGLMTNSSISYNINNLAELNYMSFIGLISIGFFLFFYFFLSDAALKRLIHLPRKTTLVLSGAALFVYAIGIGMLAPNEVDLMIWPPIFLGIVFLKNVRELSPEYEFDNNSSRLYPTIALIIVASIFSVHSISHSHDSKEIEERKILAHKLAVETDPVAEYMYAELEGSLLQDQSIKVAALSHDQDREALIEHISDKHLRGFWEKYDVQITVCQEGDSLIIQGDNVVVGCSDFFKGIIKSQGSSTIAKNFFYLENNNGRVSYLGTLEVDSGLLFMEFDSKIIPEEQGFPELLLDMEVSEHMRNALKFYSYAKFKNGKLSSQSGEFPFSGKLTKEVSEAEYLLVDEEGYNHLFYNVDESTTIILSKKLDGSLDPIFRFSYMFAMFCLLALLLGGLHQLPLSLSAIRLSFRKRIELSMIMVLVISLIPIAIGTKYYIERQYQTRNDRNIREKIQSVLIEVEHKLANEEKLTGEMQEYVAYLLQKFSHVFFTDINMYRLDGTLIASSRPKMYNEGLIGTKMNAEAYAALSVRGKSDYIHDEEIGELSFLSAYALFRNQDQEVLAYLNLPYFAKQDDVKKEVSTFFVALFNIYVVLILIAVVIALIISNKITQPLRLIQEKLSKVKVGTKNEPIVWGSKDEIGNLVEQYNRMLKELETSADLLAKSERESAWREMAKQVAHEIKNPLTPMKLSVQHLERAWNDEDVDWENKLKKFTQTLVQQIDALTNIANEFSNFAKMPKTKSAEIDLGEVVGNVIELFKESGQVEISYSNEADGSLIVLADKEQLNQVLNNLIKNGIQAIPDSTSGKIDVNIIEKEGSYVVAIADNGTGINEEEFDKIFAPNFTTKTGGMGLGLALVKNMVENSGGAVWFESKVGKGSVFSFSIPVHTS